MNKALRSVDQDSATLNKTLNNIQLKLKNHANLPEETSNLKNKKKIMLNVKNYHMQ